MALGDPIGFDKLCQKSKYFQDKFIAQLELPTYHNFTKYQFLDVLDALSFRLMVLEHVKKKHLGDDFDKDNLIRLETEVEMEIKNDLSKEINKLIFQRKSENISVVQSIIVKEMKKYTKKYFGRDPSGFTSQHHMAAETAVRKMRDYLIKRREETSELTQSLIDEESKNSTP